MGLPHFTAGSLSNHQPSSFIRAEDLPGNACPHWLGYPFHKVLMIIPDIDKDHTKLIELRINSNLFFPMKSHDDANYSLSNIFNLCFMPEVTADVVKYSSKKF